MLQKLSAGNPNAKWWIKGDGTDVVKGLWESVSGQWSGDVDLNDGRLNDLYKNHRDRIAWVKRIGLNNSTLNQIKTDLAKALDDNSTDLTFVTSGVLLSIVVYKHDIILCSRVPAQCVPIL